jgi:hypothetical protein
MINRVMCSIVYVSSCVENLVKSGTLNLGGNGIFLSNHRGARPPGNRNK